MTVPSALDPGALLNKSRVYIQRALARKSTDDLDEYQLWASLSLELLGKSALASVHPSLVADPVHWESLFAAAGRPVSTDVKTITAKTLFLRLRHLSPRFDVPMHEFCEAISQRRNAELHSGELPFKLMRLDAWQARFWHAAEVILEITDQGLDFWIGADEARAPRELLVHAAVARKSAVETRIGDAKTNFQARKESDRKKLLKESWSRFPWHHTDLFRKEGDHVWDASCPACTGKSYVTGELSEEEIVEETQNEDGIWETVARSYVPEEFHCPVCELRLRGYEELKIAGMDGDHTEWEEREIEYEPDYGND